MGTLANSVDPDEMPHDVAFHQGLHCLLRQIHLQRKKYNIFFDPLIYTIDHPGFIACRFVENSIGLKRLKQTVWNPTEVSSRTVSIQIRTQHFQAE